MHSVRPVRRVVLALLTFVLKRNPECFNTGLKVHDISLGKATWMIDHVFCIAEECKIDEGPASEGSHEMR